MGTRVQCAYACAMKAVRIGAAVALSATLVLLPAPAWACSLPAPEPLEEVLAQGEIYSAELVGVHEQRHIAYFPNLFNVIPERSASVVDRYWGEEPNLRVAAHGAEGIPLLAMDDCGKESKPVGSVSTHASSAGSIDRPRDDWPNLALESGEYGGPLSDTEAALLDAHFRPATFVSVGLDDYLLAYAFVLWRPLLAVGVVGALGYGIRRRFRDIELGKARIFDGPTAAAGVIGVTALALVVESVGVFDWIGLLVALAGSAALASLMRAVWAWFGVACLFYFTLWRGLVWEDLASGDFRLQAATGLLVIGGGSLMWAQKHWTRFPAALTVLGGAILAVIGAAEVRGYRNPVKVGALASIVTFATAFAVWWLVFRERRLSSGAPAEPPGETAEVDQRQPSR